MLARVLFAAALASALVGCKRAPATIAPDPAPSRTAPPAPRRPSGEIEVVLLSDGPDQGMHHGALPSKDFAPCRGAATLGWGLFDARIDESGVPVGTVKVVDHDGLSDEVQRCVAKALRTPPPSGGGARHLFYVAFR